MSTNQSQNVQVILSVPQEFHKIREEMAKAYDQSVEEYVLNEVICSVNRDLQEPAGTVLGFGKGTDYEDQLRAMVSGGTA